jgi:hypothetical protein
MVPSSPISRMQWRLFIVGVSSIKVRDVMTTFGQNESKCILMVPFTHILLTGNFEHIYYFKTNYLALVG